MLKSFASFLKNIFRKCTYTSKKTFRNMPSNYQKLYEMCIFDGLQYFDVRIHTGFSFLLGKNVIQHRQSSHDSIMFCYVSFDGTKMPNVEEHYKE